MPDSQDELPLFSDGGRGPALHSDSSLSAAVRAWGEDLEQAGRSIHTVKAFTGDVRLLARFLGAGHAVNAIGTHDLKNFLDWMLTRRGVPCSPKTYARRVTSLKAFFRWLAHSGVLPDDPAAPVPQQTVLSPLPEVLSSEEVDRVLRTAEGMRKAKPPDARPYTLVSLLLYSGIKKGECLGIHLNHIDLKSSEGPILWIRYGEVSRRYRERKLLLEASWVPAYREYLEQYEPQDRLFPYSPRRLEYLLEDIGAAAGLKKHLSFNMCRWTSVLTDYKSGADSEHIRHKLGISKIQWREIGSKLDRLAAGRLAASRA
ncbi:MAG TPA: site-specific integrase [Anaerolineales bacterium]